MARGKPVGYKQVWPGLELTTSRLLVQRANHLAKLPPLWHIGSVTATLWFFSSKH